MGLCADAGVATVLTNLGASPEKVREVAIRACTSDREPAGSHKIDPRIEALRLLLGREFSDHSDPKNLRRFDIRRGKVGARAMYACQILTDLNEESLQAADPQVAALILGKVAEQLDAESARLKEASGRLK
jgi:hypothetical protein